MRNAAQGIAVVVKLEDLKTRDAFLNGIEWVQRSARLMSVFTPDGLVCDWRELDNKIEAFRLYQYADRELPLPAGRGPIDPDVARTSTGDTFRSIWVLEGAGHLAGLASGIPSQGLLTKGDAAGLPEQAMIPLHAGMGMAFAEKLFGGLSSRPSASEIGRTVRRFVDACGANCRPGWEDACIEPFGLVVRCLHPNLVASVSAEAEALDPRLRALFWHGVGRGLYFVATNFLPIPGTRERIMKSVAEEARDAGDRRNALAGLIWAVTLVNLRQPAIIRSYAATCSGMIQDEFTNGVISALMAWRHMAPEDLRDIGPYVSERNYRQTGHRKEEIIWNDWIAIPARKAIADIFPGLDRRNRIPALYSYRTHDELVRFAVTGRTSHDRK